MELKQIVQELRGHSRQLVRELDVLKGVFQDTGFTYSQCHVLFEIERHKLLNLMELSQIVKLDKSTTSRVVKNLVDKGLLKVSKNGNDNRQKFFSLTELGKSSTYNNNCLASNQVENALRLLTPEEQTAVLNGLKIYARALTHSREQVPYKIRNIKQSDNPFVARLIREIMTEFNAVGEGYSINDPEVDDMYAAYKDNRAAFWVIEQNGEILGCGGIGPLQGAGADICELRKMYFQPNIRGIGLGKKMVLLCLDTAKNLGYKKCYLETLDRMWQANLLYQKMGFKKLSCQEGNTGHCSCEAFYAISL